MKYSEFRVEVEKMGLNMDSSEHRVFVRRKSGNVVFTISKSVENFVDCGWASYLGALNDGQRWQLFDLAYQLAKTPLADREEEKRYRVKFPGITRDGKNIYLMRQSNMDGTHGIDWSSEKYIFDDFPDGYLFTEKEIKSINEHYWHFAEGEAQ